MLLAAIENMQYAVTVDVLHTVIECIIRVTFWMLLVSPAFCYAYQIIFITGIFCFWHRSKDSDI